MLLIPLKTPIIQPGQELFPILQQALKDASQVLQEKDVLVVTSKVVAYSQGRLVKVEDQGNFRQLVKREADEIGETGDMVLTLKNNILIPNAGVDRSNAPENQAILWPDAPFKVAETLKSQATAAFGLKELGIIISDSNPQPLRIGTVAIALSWAGIEGVRNEREAQDLFGRKMQYTQMAIADSLASSANLLMGETDASIPMVLIRQAPVRFDHRKAGPKDYSISPKDCIYSSLRHFYEL